MPVCRDVGDAGDAEMVNTREAERGPRGRTRPGWDLAALPAPLPPVLTPPRRRLRAARPRLRVNKLFKNIFTAPW